MANWYGTCRSNYFGVKDPDAFREMMSNYEAHIIEKGDLFGFYSETENGDIPRYWPEDGDDSVSILDEIGEHIAQDHVCIIQEVGAEKARYLTGVAIAIAWTGETTQISINDIYKQAQDEFGADAKITEAVY